MPRSGLALALLTPLWACDSPSDPELSECSIPENRILDGGVGPDGIPALTDPELVPAGHPDLDFLEERDRVIGLEVDGRTVAVPHNILWWHEIVNFDFPSGRQLAVTYCPLTGSSLAFDRGVVNGVEFGVSGLLFQNNLMMYDRRSGASFWPQMERAARCGPADGQQLEMYPVMETTWAAWRALHPDTEVVGSETGHNRAYWVYPYGDYEETDELLFPMRMELDHRRDRKERVLGLPSRDGSEAIAFPFLELASEEGARAVHEDGPSGPIVVLWKDDAQGAMAFQPIAGGMELTFDVEDGRIVDHETGSEWRLDGRAVAGPLTGERLPEVAEAYVAFWFAWGAFHRGTRIWEADPIDS